MMEKNLKELVLPKEGLQLEALVLALKSLPNDESLKEEIIKQAPEGANYYVKEENHESEVEHASSYIKSEECEGTEFEGYGVAEDEVCLGTEVSIHKTIPVLYLKNLKIEK